MGKIVHLKGARIEPLALLAQVAEDKPDHVIIMLARGEDWEASWSQMSMETLVYAYRLLGLKIDDIINGKVPPT